MFRILSQKEIDIASRVDGDRLRLEGYLGRKLQRLHITPETPQHACLRRSRLEKLRAAATGVVCERVSLVRDRLDVCGRRAG